MSVSDVLPVGDKANGVQGEQFASVQVPRNLSNVWDARDHRQGAQGVDDGAPWCSQLLATRQVWSRSKSASVIAPACVARLEEISERSAKPSRAGMPPLVHRRGFAALAHSDRDAEEGSAGGGEKRRRRLGRRPGRRSRDRHRRSLKNGRCADAITRRDLESDGFAHGGAGSKGMPARHSGARALPASSAVAIWFEPGAGGGVSRTAASAVWAPGEPADPEPRRNSCWAVGSRRRHSSAGPWHRAGHPQCRERGRVTSALTTRAIAIRGRIRPRRRAPATVRPVPAASAGMSSRRDRGRRRLRSPGGTAFGARSTWRCRRNRPSSNVPKSGVWVGGGVDTHAPLAGTVRGSTVAMRPRRGQPAGSIRQG